MREIPLKSCPACGGDWFREADYYRFLREESVGPIWLTWPDLVGQISPAPMSLLVCLCGTPFTPEIGGVRGGRTPNVELAELFVSLKTCHARLKDDHHGDSLLAAAQAYLAKAESFRGLADQLKALERRAGVRIAQQDASRHSTRGRYWAPPKRKPASGDVLTRDTLVIALQEIGLTARVAKKAVKAIFEEITHWLKDGGNDAKTPLGVFQIARRPPERKIIRFGREQTLNTKPKRVAFRASRELLAACNRSKQEKILVPNMNIQPIDPNHLQCEKCGSSNFVEACFRQYMPQPSSYPGGDISPTSENPIRALVCLCGNPILPGRLRSLTPGDHTSFRKSFAAARQYRENISQEALFRMIADLYASKPQHDLLAERITKLETIFSARPIAVT